MDIDPGSPRYMGSNTLNYLTESNVGTSRAAIKADLSGKIVYDDPAVFGRLRVEQVDQNFVLACRASLKAKNTKDITLLKELAQKASQKSPDELDKEESNNKESDVNKVGRSGNHGGVEERKMYDPLVRLFGYITNFGEATTPRRFRKTNGMLKADEPHTFGFPSVSPDITVSPYGEGAPNSKKWRDRDAFCEVKPSNAQGPKPANAGTIPSIVTQSADYARLFMSARPFMLFCVGILIFGTEFCVGIFDRDGITFSPIYDMFQDDEILIRVVISLACNLSINELGFDSTVHILTDQATVNLTGRCEYPSAVVSSIGNDPRRWCTIGPPIWSSLSFLGRGTSVWRVREYIEDDNQQPSLRGNEMILKNAWRSSGRIPESDIYLSINHPPEGLAKFECGGDVTIAGCPISVENLRNKSENDISSSTPVLHRLVLATVGRPMWEYESDRHLLTGFRDALQAHGDLCDRGILHRDISAGNILLTEDKTAPYRGFITDLEFARIEAATFSKRKVEVTSTVIPQNKYNNQGRVVSRTEATTRTHTWFETTVSVRRGAGMTGTAQFMAKDILWGVINFDVAVMHEAKHDVESFIWVLSYCVMRNLCYRASHRTAPQEVREQYRAMRTLFRLAFSQTTADTILNERQSMSPGLIFPGYQRVKFVVTQFMSTALISLFDTLRDLIHRASDRLNPIPLTHDVLLAVVQHAIDAIDAISSLG